MSELSLNSSESWIDRLFSPTVKAVFLATVVGVTFFSEHDVSMSLKEGFVADIEDKRAGPKAATRCVESLFLASLPLACSAFCWSGEKSFA